MSNETFILGKELSLESSINNFKNNLRKYGFEIEISSELNPIPNVHSLHIREKTAKMLFSNGKGTSKKAAKASALGEYIERLSSNYFFADFYLGEEISNSEFVHYPNEKWFNKDNISELLKSLNKMYPSLNIKDSSNIDISRFVDLQSANKKRGICSLPFIQQSNKQTIYIPVNLISNCYLSNGISAGNSFTEAKVQAISEIFERYAKKLILKNNYTLPEIPSEIINKFSYIKESIESLKECGFPIKVLDCSLGGKYPVVCVALFNTDNCTVYGSFGSHPKFEIALQRATTELLQGRSLNNLDVFEEPSVDPSEVADDVNIETHFIDSSGLLSWDMFNGKYSFPFIEWNFEGDIKEELEYLITKVHNENKEIYIAEYNMLGSSACRVIIPGMSEINSIEEYEEFNNNIFITNLDKISSYFDNKKITKDDVENLEDFIYSSGIDDNYRLRELLGVSVDKSSIWFNFRINELLSLLYISCGKYEEAYSALLFASDFGQNFNKLHYRTILALKNVIGLLIYKGKEKLETYKDNLYVLYNKDIIDKVFNSIYNGSNIVHSIFGNLKDIYKNPTHKILLDAYNKMQKAKKINSLG